MHVSGGGMNSPFALVVTELPPVNDHTATSPVESRVTI
jgi:hypothetical protein